MANYPHISFDLVDKSVYSVPQGETLPVGIVGTSTWGPLNERTLVTGGEDFVSKFGPVHDDHLATYAALQYLREGNELYFVRVADSAAVKASQKNGNGITRDSVTGAGKDYSAGDVDIAANDTLTLIKGGDTIVTVTWATAVTDATLSQIIFHINSAVESAGYKNVIIASEATGGHLKIDTLFNGFTYGGFAAPKLGLTATPSGYASDTDGSFTVRAKYEGTYGNNLFYTVSSGTKIGTFRLDVYYSRGGNVVSVGSFDNLTVNSVEAIDSDFIEVEIATGQSGEPDLPEQSTLSPVNVSLMSGHDGNPSGTGILADTVFLGSVDVNGKATGLELFRDREQVGVYALAVPGETGSTIAKFIEGLVKERGDVTGVVDLPITTTERSVPNIVENDYGLNDSNIVIGWPWVEVTGTDGEPLKTPPSGHILGRMAFASKGGEYWQAPYGRIRGSLPGVTGVEFGSTESTLRELYGTYGVNVIQNKGTGRGIEIVGQKTQLKTDSQLSRIGTRMMFNHAIHRLLDVASEFEGVIVTAAVQEAFHKALSVPLEAIQSKGGLHQFNVDVQGANTEATLAANELHAGIYIRPYSYAEGVFLNITAGSVAVDITLISG